MLNRLVHKVLFTNEIIPYERPGKTPVDQEIKKIMTEPKNLKYETEGVPQEQSYDHYKSRVMQKQNSKVESDEEVEEAKGP